MRITGLLIGSIVALYAIVRLQSTTLIAEDQHRQNQVHQNDGSPVSKISKPDAQWRDELTPEQYHILRKKGTERAFTGRYWNHKGKGIYRCRGCELPLFDSKTKFKSGTGWPSFWAPIKQTHVLAEDDTSLGMKRTETLCARCDSHLGHVFNDGPNPTGLRYCINSAAITFDDNPESSKEIHLRTATFSAGCSQHAVTSFRQLPGVKDVTAGYTGGTIENPAPAQLSSGAAGYAEAVSVLYDPSITTYQHLLDAFWEMHNPTVTTIAVHRSAIFYHDPAQKKQSEESIDQLRASGKSGGKILTVIEPAGVFYPLSREQQQQDCPHALTQDQRSGP